MKWIFSHKFAIFCALLLIGTALWLLNSVVNPKTPNWVTVTAERGDVTTVVSVSGFVEAKNTAELAFPSTGVVTEVFVNEGARVEQGEVLATLASKQLAAERSEAVANLRAAAASLDETVAGPRAETISIAETSVANAETNLARVQAETKEATTNARKDLLSNDLEAVTLDGEETAIAPTISGTYTCQETGDYTLNTYRSDTQSGFSYTVEGFQHISNPASTDQPTAFGDCGLFAQFAAGSDYTDTTWTVEIPNIRSSTYITKLNTLTAAKTSEANLVAAAEDALRLAREEAGLSTAAPRSETVRAEEARVAEARARIARIDALIGDRSIVAPFAGTITEVAVLPGETATSEAVITLLADGSFELKARIPEIDIRKNEVGQVATAIFDAAPEETQTGTITYLSPLATEIDGVGYFEATITLESIPNWLRSGFNADIDIVIDEKKDAIRIPRRFITKTADGIDAVLVPAGQESAIKEISVVAFGNDGLAAVEGLSVGDIIILP